MCLPGAPVAGAIDCYEHLNSDGDELLETTCGQQENEKLLEATIWVLTCCGFYLKELTGFSLWRAKKDP